MTIELDPAVLIFEDGVIHVKYRDGYRIGIDEAKLLDEKQFELCGGEKVGLLIDIYGISNLINKEAKLFFNNRGKMLKRTKAVAILQKHQQKNLKTSFLSELLRPLFEVESFETKEAALIWLKKFN